MGDQENKNTYQADSQKETGGGSGMPAGGPGMIGGGHGKGGVAGVGL